MKFITNLNFGMSTADPFSQIVLGFTGMSLAPLSLVIFILMQISRFVEGHDLQCKAGVVEGNCSSTNSYLIKESSRPASPLVFHKNDFEFTLKCYRDI